MTIEEEYAAANQRWEDEQRAIAQRKRRKAQQTRIQKIHAEQRGLIETFNHKLEEARNQPTFKDLTEKRLNTPVSITLGETLRLRAAYRRADNEQV